MFVRLARLSATLATAACTGSCLVVSDPDFRGQEDCVPYFVTNEAEPLLNVKTRVSTNRFDGNVPLRSCALAKTYELHVFLDGAQHSAPSVDPNGSDERPVTIGVDLTSVQPGCHQVEIYASSKFDANDPRKADPDKPRDLAYLVWWFADTSDTKFEECGAK